MRWNPSSGSIACVMALLLGGASPALGAGETWRELAVSDATRRRVGAEFSRALAAKFQVDPATLDVHLERPRLLGDGERVHLLADVGTVRLLDVDAWGLLVGGRIVFRDLRVDYGALALRRVVLVDEPVLRPEISVRRDALVRYRHRKGILDPFFEVDAATGEVELGGAYRLKLAFFHIRPRIRVRGKLGVEGRRAVFHPAEIRVAGVPGLLRRIMQRQVDKVSRERLFADLDLRGVQLAGGHFRITGAGGATLLDQPLPTTAATAE